MPGSTRSLDETFEEWRSFAVERPGIDPELCLLALAGEQLVGSAGDRRARRNPYHVLTAVARDWRRRGIAEALKRAQIMAALDRGFTRLVTENQHENAPMRRLNEKLGYEPAPGSIVYRGPFLV